MKQLFVACAAFAAVCLSAPSLALAQQGSEGEEPSMRELMGAMQVNFKFLREHIGADDSDLSEAVDPLLAMQEVLLKIRLMTPPDLGELDIDLEEAKGEIRLRLTMTLRAALDLEMALLDNDREAAQVALDIMRSMQREGHNNVQLPLRDFRRDKLLATLDDLPVDETLAANLVGTYLIAEMGAEGVVERSENGKLKITLGGKQTLDLMRQSNGEFRARQAPQAVIRFVPEGAKAEAMMIEQQGNEMRAERTAS